MRFASLVALTVALDALLLWMPPGMSMLDARFYYGADEALGYLASLGAHGRSAYFVHECIDLGFIATYTVLFRALAKRWRLRRGAARLVFAPGLPDLLETGGILVLLAMHPSGPRFLAAALGFFTLLKWVGFVAVAIAVLAGRHKRRVSNSDNIV